MIDSPPLFILGHWPVTMISLLMGALALFVFILVFVLMVGSRKRTVLEAKAAERARDTELHLNALLQTQAEMQGRMQTMAEIFGQRQAELNQSIREQLTGMTSNIGQTIHAQTKSTHENLAKLQERLAVIDTAQSNIQSLAGQVVQLQAILANKQTRGAFGQGRMEAIIADGLPLNAYSFQTTLSNGNRPDCLVFMPNNAPSLVIDAKFPLEAWTAMQEAENSTVRDGAKVQFSRDMDVHIKAISEKYLIAGETQDTAFLFVPSESIFATIHEHFEALVQKAHRARVIIVSPSLLMLSIQVVQAVLKDARMREQAHLIQSEVAKLVKDISLLDDRVHKLQSHFQLANKDIDDILISSGKVSRRGGRIETLELGPELKETQTVEVPQQPSLRLVEDD